MNRTHTPSLVGTSLLWADCQRCTRCSGMPPSSCKNRQCSFGLAARSASHSASKGKNWPSQTSGSAQRRMHRRGSIRCTRSMNRMSAQRRGDSKARTTPCSSHCSRLCPCRRSQ
eukprot:Amastigsp_a676324_2544.p3 type:complete len:114 gc:universal Amastigsp_a676324_2544:479-138(-)